MATPDLQALLDELAGWAAARGHAPTLHRYGDGPDQEADLLLPDGDGPHRLAVLLHGGFWRAPFKREIMAALAVDLAARGWATWNVEYRRVGAGGGVPQTIEDVRAALDALPEGFERVVLIGHSAGGQLALCVAGVPRVAAVVSLAGVCDLETGARERIGEGAVLEFLGGTPEEAAGAVRDRRSDGAACRPRPRCCSCTATPTTACPSSRAATTCAPPGRRAGAASCWSSPGSVTSR